MPSIQTVRDLSNTIRGHRLQRHWSQEELAARAEVSRSWLVDVERGKATIELGRVLQVLHALDLGLVVVSEADSGVKPRRRSRQPARVDLDEHLEQYRLL